MIGNKKKNVKQGNKFIKAYLRCWLYLNAIIGAVLMTLVVVNWDVWSPSMKLTAFATTALICHVFEEWKFPGGFFFMLNIIQNKDYPLSIDRYPMNQLTDMLTNLIAILVGIVVLLVGAPYYLSLMWFYLCFSDSLGHIILGLKMKKKYASKGKKTIYNPGLITSLFCFIPTFIGFIVAFVITGMPTVMDFVISIIGCTLLHVICLKGPEKLWADPESPYPYDWGKGYFVKFED